jgi:hypothetical protein
MLSSTLLHVDQDSLEHILIAEHTWKLLEDPNKTC